MSKEITEIQYFFYEWLLIEKDMTPEKWRNISVQGRVKLAEEFEAFWNKD